jgi:hypothetical protein
VHEDDYTVYDADRKGLWFGHGVYYGSRQVATPACASPALADVGPLINTACFELDETNNFRLASGLHRKLSTVNLIYQGHVWQRNALVDYGRSEALRLKQTRVM